MTTAEVRECDLDPGRRRCSPTSIASPLSGRAHDGRSGATVADLAGVARVGEEEMAQALQLRRRDRV